jgi:hypothetical protein
LNVNCRLVESPTFWTPTRFTSSKQKGSHLHSALIARLMHWFLRCYFSLSLQLRPSQVRRLTAAGEYKPFVKFLSSNGTKIAELQTRIQELLKATTRNPQCSRPADLFTRNSSASGCAGGSRICNLSSSTSDVWINTQALRAKQAAKRR